MSCCTSFFTAVTLVFALVCLRLVRTDFYTAISHLQTLVETEGEVTRILDNYLEVEELRLNQIKRHRRRYETLYRSAMNDSETFLGNPLNAYLLVKSLTSDWGDTVNLVGGTNNKAIVEEVKELPLSFPGEEDLKGAAGALMRLQHTYQLEIEALARGDIQGNQQARELSAGDCFELGRQAYIAEDYEGCLQWMGEAEKRVLGEEVRTTRESDVLEYMAYSYFMTGNIGGALKLIKYLLKNPIYPLTSGNLADLQVQLERILESDTAPVAPAAKHWHWMDLGDTSTDYWRLCRGEKLVNAATDSQLRCYNSANKDAYYLLQPFRVEEVCLSPWIVIYHDALRDWEAEVIKSLARPKLERAVVQDFTSGQTAFAEYRISKSAWIDEDDFTRVLNRRMTSMTGLDTDSAESLHVLNYGIGGHYEPHHDYAHGRDHVFSPIGNRIATLIFYLTDVEAGGATVFPTAGVSVKPRKGSASFWYNLHANGNGDPSTIHAACPVLAGTKWVANKWFHEKGNEFRMPCRLDPNQ